MDRRWVIALLALASCDHLLQLTTVPDPVDAPPSEGPDAPPPVNCMRDVAVGRAHSCAVGPLGEVFCWGNNQQGQVLPAGQEYIPTPTRVVLPSPAVQIGAGYELSCARLEDGSVWCWGASDEGQLGSVDMSARGPLSIVLPGQAFDLEVGARQACVILASDHSVMCWGSNKFAALAENPAMAFSASALAVGNSAGTLQLSVGHRHACLLDANHLVSCWGPNSDGQVGQPSSDTPVIMPTPVATLGAVQSVAVSGRTSCVVANDGSVQCWGRGIDGELANGAFNSSEQPLGTLVTTAQQLAIGTMGGCALHADGTVECWGNFDGARGASEVTASPQAAMIDRVTKIAAHYYHQCALSKGQVVCWGDDTDGSLGRGARAVALSPNTVMLPGMPTAMAVEAAGACAVVGGSAYCWGANDYGQLGTGTLIDHLAPTQVAGVSGATGIAAYFHHACTWGASGAQCWGRDYSGEIGDGTTQRAVVAATAFPAAGVTQMALGLDFTCAVVSGGAVQCVGRNAEGETGKGTFSAEETSLQMAGTLSGVTNLTAGEEFVCAIAGGGLYCWGHDGDHQIGDGGTNDVATPKNILIGHTFVDVAAGRYHACGIATTGTIYCWGANGEGQLGQGDQLTRASPVTVTLSGGETPVKVVAGEANTCVLTSVGKVYCWGPSDNGELGNGTTNGVLAPTVISSLAGATELAHGHSGACAMIAGTLKCWGVAAMLGDGDYSRSLPAPPVGLPCQ